MQPIWSVSSFLQAIGLEISFPGKKRFAGQWEKEAIYCFIFAILEFLLPKGAQKHTDVQF